MKLRTRGSEGWRLLSTRLCSKAARKFRPRAFIFRFYLVWQHKRSKIYISLPPLLPPPPHPRSPVRHPPPGHSRVSVARSCLTMLYRRRSPPWAVWVDLDGGGFQFWHPARPDVTIPLSSPRRNRVSLLSSQDHAPIKEGVRPPFLEQASWFFHISEPFPTTRFHLTILRDSILELLKRRSVLEPA